MRTFYSFALCLILSLSVSGDGKAQDANLEEPTPEWKACQTAEDCTTVRGFCGYPETVSLQARQRYEFWLKNQPPAACALLKPAKSITLTCPQKQCTIKVKR